MRAPRQALAAAILGTAAVCVTASAQAPMPPERPPAASKPAPAPPAQPQQPQPVQPQTAIPLDQALYLIRSTLLTLNDANRSGNYSVLRDLAVPSFQTRNSAADLAVIFNELRKRNFDLYGAALLAPQLTSAPQIDANKVLRLTGVFPTRPLQIAFDLLYEVHAGQWRLLGISVTTPEAPKPVARSP